MYLLVSQEVTCDAGIIDKIPPESVLFRISLSTSELNVTLE